MKRRLFALLSALALASALSSPLYAAPDAGPDVIDAVSSADHAPAAAPTAEPAPPPVPPVVDDAVAQVEKDPVAFGLDLYQAAKSGKWAIVIGGVLLLLTWAIRSFRDRLSFLQGDRGGVLAVGLMAALAIGGLSLAGGTAPSGELVLAVITGMLAAMGGWSGVKRLLWPQD